MTWHQAKEVALTATLLAVLLMLYMHITFLIRHSAG
jgi:hypothetical protein